MSVRVTSAVWRSSTAEGNPRMVLLALADAAADDGVSWEHEETIAAKCRLSTRRVRDAIRKLEAIGEVETRKAQRGRRRQNVYRVRVGDVVSVDYDRLPFVLDEPFSDDRTNPPVVRPGRKPGRPDDFDRDDRTDPPPVGDPSSYRDPYKGPARGRPSSTALSRVDVEETSSGPPKLSKIDGRDLAFDVLAEATGVDPAGNRAREVGIALNGSPRSGLAVGIREMCWRDFGRPEGGEPFERAVAESIRLHARLYREAMRGAALTPLALAKWWTDLDRARPEAAAERAARRAVELAEQGR